MYQSFYNLHSKPFRSSADPKFLWLDEKHKEALATLQYGVLDSKGFILMTGDIGTGKTTLINALMAQLDNNIIAARVHDPELDRMEFFNYIAREFNIQGQFETKGEFLNHFKRFLHKSHTENKKVLLIIDEAQRVKSDLLGVE